MIRINLLAVERSRAKKKLTFAVGQKTTLIGVLILGLAGALVAWRYLALARDSRQLDADIASAQRETAQLRTIIQQVQQFEQQKGQLQQRVSLIEQLRKSQSGPVHMLDQISRALPPMLWLTELKQAGADVVIDGKCTTLTGLSDFVANLESSGYFKKSVEIVSTQVEALTQPPGELIKFSIKAQFVPPSDAPATSAAGAAKKAG